MGAIRTLLIDNYDSYTFNLYQLIAEVNSALPTVVRNDEVDWPQLSKRIAAGEFHNVVISPGPGTPARPADIGVNLELLRHGAGIPVLGVCLGFQALALAHGANVMHGPEPVHGRLSGVEHSGHALFEGIPSGPDYQVVRYHSLVVQEASLPPCLQPIAWTCGQHHALQLDGACETREAGQQQHHERGAQPGHVQQPGQAQHQMQQQRRRPWPTSGGSSNGGSSSGGTSSSSRVLMGLAHRSRPHFGVQFHPESIATGFGAALLANFRDLTCHFHSLPLLPPPGNPAGPPGMSLPPRAFQQPGGKLQVLYQALPGLLDAAGGSEELFWQLFGGSSGGRGEAEHEGISSSSGAEAAAADTFWLDTAAADRGRFSYMGGPGGSLWRHFSYKLPPAGDTAATSAAAAPLETAQPSLAAGDGSAAQPGTLTVRGADGSVSTSQTSFLSFLEELLETHRCQVCPEDAAALPFDFWGGLVGYLGYELKAECAGCPNRHASLLPDAAFFLADRLLAVDHHTATVYMLALHREGQPGSREEAQAWVDATAARVRGMAAAGSATGVAGQAGPSQPQLQQHPSQQQPSQQQRNGWHGAQPGPAAAAAAGPPAFQLRESKQQYLGNIEACMQALHDGESYEVCLTTTMAREQAPDPVQLYRTLRRVNPAPYGAFLHFGEDGPQICCSSPERFLRGGRGGVLEARPIKGTAPRSADPQADREAAAALAASEKDRAENLMIVDLLRNDLGRVCVPGSVHVPGLMEIESYATVHQMVSTVRGLRQEGASLVDCLRASFPGGSMTGAPKLRTMHILDRLEGGPRGVYSGSIGYISFNDTFDLNIVIRTAVIHKGQISIGAGGAIVVQSEPEGEYEEMRLKARALLRAVGMCDGCEGPATVAEDQLSGAAAAAPKQPA